MSTLYIYNQHKKLKLDPKQNFKTCDDFLFTLMDDAKTNNDIWVLFEPATKRDYNFLIALIAIKRLLNNFEICLLLEDSKEAGNLNDKIEPIKRYLGYLDKFMMYDSDKELKRIINQFKISMY